MTGKNFPLLSPLVDGTSGRRSRQDTVLEAVFARCDSSVVSGFQVGPELALVSSVVDTGIKNGGALPPHEMLQTGRSKRGRIMSKVTIELTSAQREQIRSETGDEVMAFTWEQLENRDAPKIGGGVSEFVRTGGSPDDKPLRRNGGMTALDPAT
jgi:hypothetical protein